MSTTIDVYPASARLPLVEETRTQTQELFQQLLDTHCVESTIEVRPFYPNPGPGRVRFVEDDLRWKPGLSLGFAYWINGEWDSSSWPECVAREHDEVIQDEDLWAEDRPLGAAPEFLGQWRFAEDLADLVPSHVLNKVLQSDHYWYEYRNLGGPAVASTGYGLVAAAPAEATDGVLASWDSAFDIEHNGETSDQFLRWWGDRQLTFYGADLFGGRQRGRPA